MAAGSIDLAPNRVRLYRASSESTAPIAAPAAATRGSDMDPISSSWRNNSRNSNGGVTAARSECHENIARSPNHSRKVLMGPRPGINRAHCPAGEGPMSPASFKSRSLTGSTPGRERRAGCSDVYGKARSAGTYRRIPTQYSLAYTSAGYSCQSGTHPWLHSDLGTWHIQRQRILLVEPQYKRQPAA